MDQEPEIDLIARVRSGDQDAASELYGRYVSRLLRIVFRQIDSSSVAARLDPEDVVQSAVWSFVRRLREGEFKFDDEEDIWKLLTTVVLNKTRNQIERNLAARRSVNRESRVEDRDLEEQTLRRLQMQPSISDALAFRETLQQLFAKLDTTDATVLQMRLEGYSQQEIADELDLAARTIRRRLVGIRSVVAELLTDGDSNSGHCSDS